MRKKHLKVILSAALSLCCFFLIFTISVSAVTVSIPDPDFDKLDFDYTYNTITVETDDYSSYTGTVGDRYTFYGNRYVNGVEFKQTIFEYASYLYDLEDDDTLFPYGPTDISSSAMIDITNDFIWGSAGDPIYLNYYFYLCMDDSSGVQIVPYKSVVYNGIEEINVPFKKVFEERLNNDGLFLYVYQATLLIEDTYDWDDASDFYIKNYANSVDGYVGSDSWIFSGISTQSGLYYDPPNIDWYTGEVIPDSPGSGSDYEPADPEIENSIDDNSDKLDQMNDYFNQPAPDISDALDNLDPGNMSGISGFFDSNSRFNAFLTSLMAVGVSFGLVGYVLHGKK